VKEIVGFISYQGFAAGIGIGDIEPVDTNLAANPG